MMFFPNKKQWEKEEIVHNVLAVNIVDLLIKLINIFIFTNHLVVWISFFLW